jgi:ABC-type xylose transport system permease subunit
MIKLCVLCLTLGSAVGGVQTALHTRDDRPSYFRAGGGEYAFRGEASWEGSNASAAERLHPDTIREALGTARTEAVSFSELLITDEAL